MSAASRINDKVHAKNTQKSTTFRGGLSVELSIALRGTDLPSLMSLLGQFLGPGYSTAWGLGWIYMRGDQRFGRIVSESNWSPYCAVDICMQLQENWCIPIQSRAPPYLHLPPPYAFKLGSSPITTQDHTTKPKATRYIQFPTLTAAARRPGNTSQPALHKFSAVHQLSQRHPTPPPSSPEIWSNGKPKSPQSGSVLQR